MSHLLNSGTCDQVEKNIENCNSRKDLRMALNNERENKNRKTVIELLEKKLEV